MKRTSFFFLLALCSCHTPDCGSTEYEDRVREQYIKKNTECKESTDCEIIGHCTYVIGDWSLPGGIISGKCEPTTREDCEQSVVCKRYGRCVAIENVCSARLSYDCRHSTMCKESGECEIFNNECLPGSDRDCVKSIICMKYERCYLKKGKRNVCVTKEML